MPNYFDKTIYLCKFLIGIRLKELICRQRQPWNLILNANKQRGNLILGRILLKSNFDELQQQFKQLSLIVSCVEDFELMSYPPLIHIPSNTELIDLNIIRLHVPIRDFSAVISFNLIESVLETMHVVLAQGRDIYIHCRAGQGRSWLVCMCYLIRYEKLSIFEATNLLSKQRRVVNPTKKQIEFINQYFQYLKEKHPQN